MQRRAPTSADFRALAEFRYQMRKFVHSMEKAARSAGLEPQQHLALLQLRAAGQGRLLNVGELAERLQIEHHSAVELLNRLAKRGFVERMRQASDRRRVTVCLNDAGEAVLRKLSLYHLEALRSRAPRLVRILQSLLNRPTEVSGRRAAEPSELSR